MHLVQFFSCRSMTTPAKPLMVHEHPSRTDRMIWWRERLYVNSGGRLMERRGRTQMRSW